MPRFEFGDKIGDVTYTLPPAGGVAAPAAAGATPAAKVDQKAKYTPPIDPATGAIPFTLDPFDPATMVPLVNLHVLFYPKTEAIPSGITAAQLMGTSHPRSTVPIAQPAAGAAPAQPTTAAPPATPTTISVPKPDAVQRGTPYIAQAIHEYAS